MKTGLKYHVRRDSIFEEGAAPRFAAVLPLLFASPLLAGSWALGLGAGSASYVAPDSSTVTYFDLFNVVRSGYRLEAEAGYYSGKQGFNVIGTFGENIARLSDNRSLLLDSHIALLGEYRLILLEQSGIIQGTFGLGPSLHFSSYKFPDTLQRFPVLFTLDPEIAVIVFVSKHLHLRLQGIYSFPPLSPNSGVWNVTLRAVFRT